MFDFWERLRRLMDGDPRQRWDALKALQREVWKEPRGSSQATMLQAINEAFEQCKSESRMRAERADRNYRELGRKVDAAADRVRYAAESELYAEFNRLKELQAEMKAAELLRDQRRELFDRLQTRGFEACKSRIEAAKNARAERAYRTGEELQRRITEAADRIREACSDSLRTEFERLKELQAELRAAELLRDQRRKLYEHLQRVGFEPCIARMNEEKQARQQFAQQATKNYEELEHRITEASDRVRDASGDALRTEFEGLKELQTEIKAAELLRDQRRRLYEQLQQAGFEPCIARMDEEKRLRQEYAQRAQQACEELRREIIAAADRIRDASGASLRSEFDELKQLQEKIKAAALLRDQRQELHEQLQHAGFEPCIARMNEERRARQEYAERAQETFQELGGRITEAAERIRDASGESLRTEFHGLKELQAEIKAVNLLRDQRGELHERLQSLGFAALDERRDELRQLSVQRRRELDELHGVPFDQLDIPELPGAQPEFNPPPPRRTSTPTGPLMDAYPLIFSFSGDRRAEFRPQQLQFMELCYEGITQRRDVVIEGPTGLGKTRALLASILPFLQEDPAHRVCYATRTITQVTNVISEIRAVGEVSQLPITATLHIGAARVRNEIARCYDKVADFDDRNQRRLDQGKPPWTTDACNWGCTRFAFQHPENNQPYDPSIDPVVDIDYLLSHLDWCPRGIFRKASRTAQILVIPHTYLFDSHWRDINLPHPGKTVLVVDEAHNFLTDAGSKPFLILGKGAIDDDEEDYEFTISRTDNRFHVADLIERIERRHFKSNPEVIRIHGLDLRAVFHYLRPLQRQLEHVITSHVRVHDDPVTVGGTVLAQVVDSLGDGFLDNLARLSTYLTAAKLALRDQPHLRRLEQPIYSCSQLVDALNSVLSHPIDFALTVTPEEHLFLNLHPKWNTLRATAAFRSRIYTSATLSPPADVSYMLNARHPLHSRIDPVFPDKNYCPFFVVGANSASKEDSPERTLLDVDIDTVRDVLRHAICAAAGKNIGVFASSNRVVLEVAGVVTDLQADLDFVFLPYIRSDDDEQDAGFVRHFDDGCARLGVTVSGYSDNTTIEVFKAAGCQSLTAVLLGVSGGTLAEGVDYYGDQMEMVVTIGLPYPSSAAERVLNRFKEDYFFMQCGDRRMGEDLAYKQDAFRKLAQSIGRSHRRMTDRGVVICIDERLMAIKNTGSSGYEVLSIRNALKNLSLLQRPLRRVRHNVVVPDHVGDDRRLLEYMATGMCRKDAFISTEEMEKRIRSFYGGRS